MSRSNLVIPASIMRNERYIQLSPHAKILLLDIVSQLDGENNGYLIATWNFLLKRGWRSPITANRAKKELLESGMLHLKENGGPHKSALFSVPDDWVRAHKNAKN